MTTEYRMKHGLIPRRFNIAYEMAKSYTPEKRGRFLAAWEREKEKDGLKELTEMFLTFDNFLEAANNKRDRLNENNWNPFFRLFDFWG